MVVYRLVALAAVSVSLCAAPGEPSPEIQRAVSLSNEVVHATLAGDFEKVINLTNPRVVDLMGGKANAIAGTKQAMQNFRESGLAFIDYKTETPSFIFRRKDQIFIIIPTQFSMSTPKGKMRAGSYFLGISEDRGATWSFADGAGFRDPSLRARLFPDLPPEVVLPTINPPQIVN